MKKIDCETRSLSLYVLQFVTIEQLSPRIAPKLFSALFQKQQQFICPPVPSLYSTALSSPPYLYPYFPSLENFVGQIVFSY